MILLSLNLTTHVVHSEPLEYSKQAVGFLIRVAFCKRTGQSGSWVPSSCIMGGSSSANDEALEDFFMPAAEESQVDIIHNVSVTLTEHGGWAD